MNEANEMNPNYHQVLHKRQDEKLDSIMEYVKDIPGIKSDIKWLKADMKDVKFDIEVLKLDVGELKTDVAELKIDMKDVKGRLSKLEPKQ